MTLPALLERIEGATGADRLLEVHLHAVLGFDALYASQNREEGTLQHWYKYGQFDLRDNNPFHFISGFGDSPDIPRYTASLDAAIALVEKVLPARAAADHEAPEIRLQFCRDLYANAVIDRDTFGGDHVYDGAGKTPALALLAALLRALIAQGRG